MSPQQVDQLWFLPAFVGWLAVVVGLTAAATSALRRRSLPRRELLALAGLFVGSLAMRVALATWGPGDLRMNLRGTLLTYDVGEDALRALFGEAVLYGPGPNGLLGPLFLALPRRFETLVAVALVAGSLAPVVLQRALAARVTPLHAWAAALLLAISPLAVRWSGEGNRQAQMLLLFAVAAWGLARYQASGRARYLVPGAAAALVAVLTRPEGVLVFALLGPLWLLGARGRRLGPLLAIAPVVALTLLYRTTFSPLASIETPHIPLGLISPATSVWLDPAFQGWALIGLTLAGLAVGLWRRSPLVVAAAVALLLVSQATRHMPTADLQMASARYQSLSVLAAAVCAGAALEALVRRFRERSRRVATALAGALVLAATTPALLVVTRPRTIDDEYGQLLAWLRELPPGTAVFSVEHPVIDAGLVAPRTEAHSLDIDWNLIAASLDEVYSPPPNGSFPEGPPLVLYYDGGMCAVTRESMIGLFDTYPIEALCEEARARFGDRPLWRAELPAVGFRGERYREDPVRIGLFVVDDRRAQ